MKREKEQEIQEESVLFITNSMVNPIIVPNLEAENQITVYQTRVQDIHDGK